MKTGCMGEPFHHVNEKWWLKLDEASKKIGARISVVRLGRVCYTIIDDMNDDIVFPVHIDENGIPRPEDERRVIKRMIEEIG